MSNLKRAEELVQTIERDATFRAEVEAAQTVGAKRGVLDAHGFRDIGLEDMRAYVESRGGHLIVPGNGQELSEQELAAVAGGLTTREIEMYAGATAIGLVLGVPIAASAAA